MRYWQAFLGSILFCGSMLVFAEQAVDHYVFDTPAQQTQFFNIVSQLRCVVCQNQTLADSDAPLAQDLRREILQKVQAGDSSEMIFQFMVERYGDFVLYHPPLNAKTGILWFGPFFLLIVLLVVWYRLTQKRNILDKESTAPTPDKGAPL